MVDGSARGGGEWKRGKCEGTCEGQGQRRKRGQEGKHGAILCVGEWKGEKCEGTRGGQGQRRQKEQEGVDAANPSGALCGQSWKGGKCEGTCGGQGQRRQRGQPREHGASLCAKRFLCDCVMRNKNEEFVEKIALLSVPNQRFC